MPSRASRFDKLHVVASVALAAIATALVAIDFTLVYVILAAYVYYAYLCYKHSNIVRRKFRWPQWAASTFLAALMLVWIGFEIKFDKLIVDDTSRLKTTWAFFAAMFLMVMVPVVILRNILPSRPRIDHPET